MGLFDYVRCDWPLPDFPDALKGCEFQTKDFDAPYLETYTITADGKLLSPSGVEMPFHGDVEFYTSNFSGCWGQQMYTSDGRDFERVEYRARFTEGAMSSLVRTDYHREPALPISAMRERQEAEQRKKDAPPDPPLRPGQQKALEEWRARGVGAPASEERSDEATRGPHEGV